MMLGIGPKLRDARIEQNLSLRELAAKTDVSASLLSQIENNKANPSVRTLHSLADALELPVDYFFPEREEHDDDVGEMAGLDKLPVAEFTASELRMQQAASPNGADSLATKIFEQNGYVEPGPKSPILRKDGRPTIQLEGDVSWARLTPNKEEELEFMEITYQPGATSGARMSHHKGREFVLVMAGELTLDLGFDQHKLYSGDSTIFDSGTPHRLSNHGDEPMRALSVICH